MEGADKSGCLLFLLFFSTGMSIILGIAEGEVFVNDAEVQKSALQVILLSFTMSGSRAETTNRLIK